MRSDVRFPFGCGWKGCAYAIFSFCLRSPFILFFKFAQRFSCEYPLLSLSFSELENSMLRRREPALAYSEEASRAIFVVLTIGFLYKTMKSDLDMRRLLQAPNTRVSRKAHQGV